MIYETLDQVDYCGGEEWANCEDYEVGAELVAIAEQSLNYDNPPTGWIGQLQQAGQEYEVIASRKIEVGEMVILRRIPHTVFEEFVACWEVVDE